MHAYEGNSSVSEAGACHPTYTKWPGARLSVRTDNVGTEVY